MAKRRVVKKIVVCARFYSGVVVMLRCLIFLGAVVAVSPGFSLDLGDYDMVDLSHAYDDNTLFWPTSPTHFTKETLAYGETEGGWFYSSYSICMPEHGGTHLDAPRHFAAGGDTTEAIPLQKLISPLVVIDVSGKATLDSSYRLTLADVAEHEQEYGEIKPGSTVLLRTDWSRYWPNAKAYLGDDTPGDASKLRFPSFGPEAAGLLVNNRGVVGLGVDTASIDYGRSTDFMVHRVVAEKNVIGLENLTGLAALPPRGGLLIALPMKIGGGSGGPVRVVAMIPKRPAS
jgi:kynurenine formamidase